MTPQLPPAGPPNGLLPGAPAKQYYPNPATETSSGGLLDILQSLRRRKATIAICCVLGGVLGFLSTIPRTPIYHADASLEIQPINQDFLQMRNVSPTSEGSAEYYPDYDLQTQAQIIESRGLLDRVAAKLKHDHQYAVTYPDRISQWRDLFHMQMKESALDRALAYTESNVKVRAKPNTRLLEIDCDSPDPKMAADFVNTLTAEYIDESLAARWETSQHTGEWLTRQMEDVRLKLERSESALQNYARQTGLMFTGEKDNIAEDKLRQMQEELSRATADRIAKESKYELASKAPPDSLGEVLDNATLRDDQAKLTDLRRQLADLSVGFTDSYPKVKKLQAQIEALQTAFDSSRNDILRRYNTDYQVALQREKLLSASYDNQAGLVNEQAAKVTHYNILKHEVDTGRQIYDSMLQRVKESGIAAALRASNVRVVDPAEPAKSPYKPNAPISGAIGCLGGLFLGVWAAALRSKVDRALRDPSQTTSTLGAPLLGVVPGVPAPRRWRRASESALSSPVGSAGKRAELISWQDTDSLPSEAFRALTASLLFGNRLDAAPPRIIVVTSPQPQEGKTTVVSNLAITLAKSRQRVLLVDGDMRRLSLSRAFGVAKSEGFGDLLEDDALSVPRLEALIQPTPVSGLSILPSGPSVSASTSLLYSPKLTALLGQLRKMFDVVLIDTPPMLQIPDARILGRHADDTVLVIRSARTTREMAGSALQRLAEDGIHIAGVILNDWDPKDSDRYSYYSDYHKSYSRYYLKSAG